MNNNMNDITRVGLTANQLKNQFPSMAIKTVAASLQKELPMTLSGVQMKELNTTLQNAAYSKEMLAEISLPDLIKFESELFENEYFANESKVGKKIFEIISGWKHFVHLGDTIYFHARCLGKNNQPYLEQEMLKAPVMISSHGRYNEIGRSCYYFADTKEGALTEVYKHCGSKKPSVQIAKLKKM